MVCLIYRLPMLGIQSRDDIDFDLRWLECLPEIVEDILGLRIVREVRHVPALDLRIDIRLMLRIDQRLLVLRHDLL